MFTIRTLVIGLSMIAAGIAAVAAVTAGSAAAEDAPFAAAKFATSGVPERRAVQLALSEPGRGTLSVGGTAMPVQWRHQSAPDLVRVATEDHRVWYFLVGRTALREFESGTPLGFPAGWTQKSLGPPAGAAKLFVAAPDGGPFRAFALTSATTADWYDRRGFLETSCVSSAGGGITITLPDKSVLAFTPNTERGAAYKDSEGGLWGPVGADAAGASDKFECIDKLQAIGGLYVVRSLERRGTPKYDGAALLLSWRKAGALLGDGRNAGLRCPADTDLRPYDDACKKAYDEVDLTNPPDDLCSYAARDFTNHPLGKSEIENEPIACCRCGKDGRSPHHGDVVPVVFADGRVRTLTRDELGLPPDAPIVVGPDSKSPLLKKLLQVPKKR